MVTIKQIADLAGVSRGTVDRVLNNRGRVNKETERRIREIAQSLNYMPSKASRSLSMLKRRVKLGYIIFPQDENPFFKQVEAGIQKKAQELAEYGVTLVKKYGDYTDPEYQNQLIDELIDEGVAGIAFCGFNTPATISKLKQVSKSGIPVVTVNSDIPESGRLAYVGSDYYKSGRSAGQLLDMLTSGKVNVGIILGSRNILCHSSRVEGFSAYINEHAPNISISKIAENNDDDIQSYSIAKNMLASDESINALFLASAGTYGVCRAVEELPEERRPIVICYDCLPSIVPMLKRGIVAATICQEPDYQGSKPLDILYNYIAMDVQPSREYYYTKIEIVISESL